jgi:hypothetical protein
MNKHNPAIAFYERAADALPATPHTDRALADGALIGLVKRAASELGYDVG